MDYQNQSPAIIVDAIKKSNEGIDKKGDTDKSDVEGSKNIKIQRSNSKINTERQSRTQKLRRQATAFDDTLPILPFNDENSVSPENNRRRDSLSPDNILIHKENDEEMNTRQRNKLQSHSSSNARDSRSLESSSCCSSRDASPCPKIRSSESIRQTRRQSTTEEILIARGFRRQSTTEEMIRCRNFRRQSSQSDDVCRYRGRRDSSAQIIDGTIGTMTVETTSTFFDSSTQTGTLAKIQNENVTFTPFRSISYV